MRKKMLDFSKLMIPEVLRGKQSLVDLALWDSTRSKTYNQREILLLKHRASTNRQVSAFHSVGQGETFCSRDTRLAIGDTFSRFFITTLGVLKKIPFLRILLNQVQDSKGMTQIVPSWFEGKDFIQHDLERLESLIEKLDKLHVKLRDQLHKLAATINPIPHGDNCEFGQELRPYLDSTNFVNKKEGSAKEFNFSIKTLLSKWTPEQDVFMHGENVDETPIDQPSLSMKLGWLQDKFTTFFRQYVSCNYFFTCCICIHTLQQALLSFLTHIGSICCTNS